MLSSLTGRRSFMQPQQGVACSDKKTGLRRGWSTSDRLCKAADGGACRFRVERNAAKLTATISCVRLYSYEPQPMTTPSVQGYSAQLHDVLHHQVQKL